MCMQLLSSNARTTEPPGDGSTSQRGAATNSGTARKLPLANRERLLVKGTPHAGDKSEQRQPFSLIAALTSMRLRARDLAFVLVPLYRALRC